MRRFDAALTFQKLQVFCTVADLGSVTRAAEHLNIAQPVVTAHLRSLERRLGYPLVERVGRNIALTEAGERVHGWATEVITRTHEIERELAGMEKGEVGHAVVATSMSIGSYALPPLLTDFHRLRPDGLVTLQVSNPQAAVDTTRIGGCDFAVILLAPDQNLDGLAVIPLWTERLLLVGAPASRWWPASFRPKSARSASKPWASPAVDARSAAAIELGAVPFVSTPRGLTRRDIEENLLKQHGLTERDVVLELGHPEALKHAEPPRLLRRPIGFSHAASGRQAELR